MNVVSAITGLPYVGKTTLFNLLTGAHATTGAFAGAESETNVGVAKVPDRRVEDLAALYRPKKITHAEVMYRDIGLAHAEKPGQAISPQKLGDLRTADAIVHVVFLQEIVELRMDQLDALSVRAGFLARL